MRVVPLPGDRETVLAAELARAVKRDNRLTVQEIHAGQAAMRCAWMTVKYGRRWPCTWERPCFYCQRLEIDLDFWE